MNKIIPLLLLLKVCVGYKILALLPYTGKSHHMVFEPLLQELTDRGHNLTVVSFFPSSKPRKNRRDVSLEGLAPLNVETLNLEDFDYSYFGLERYFEHVPLATQLAKANLQLCKKLLDSPVLDEFVKAKGDYNLILLEHFNSDCMLGLVHNYGLPSVGLSSCAMMPWHPSRLGAPDNPSYVPLMTLPLTDTMTLLERMENTFFLYFYKIWFEVVIRWEEQRMLKERFGRELPPLGDVGRNTSVLLVNTHHSWGGARAAPPAVVEVGGIHLHNRKVQPLPPDLDRWMSEAKHGVILFSFGSLIRGSSLPPKRLRAILNVFARLPQRVVWKWEDREDELAGLPDNVLIMKWLPQYDILNHPNCVAFITHGGMLSLTEALSAEVAVLTVPVLGDQFGNAAHARSAGFAEVLRLRDMDERSLQRALDIVLSDQMRARVKNLSRIWKDREHSPMDTAVYHIEKTARHHGLDISTRARWMPVYQLMLLDLAAVVVAVTSFVVGITCVCVECLCRRRKVKQN